MAAAKEPDGATPLDPDEREGLRFKHVTTRGELDHLEQANIQEGLQWLSRRRYKDILNETFVRELPVFFKIVDTFFFTQPATLRFPFSVPVPGSSTQRRSACSFALSCCPIGTVSAA